MNENKLRLADILGVEEGEEWEIPDAVGTKCRIQGGRLEIKTNDNGWYVPGLWALKICKLIERPECIIRAPRLTEAELTICKVAGAKWVSLNAEEVWVRLWSTKPEFEEDGLHYRSNDAILLALANGIVFPSVHPGDLIEVP